VNPPRVFPYSDLLIVKVFATKSHLKIEILEDLLDFIQIIRTLRQLLLEQ